MIGTEFFHGQGFGNQLFCYITARAIAIDNSCEFGTVGQELFGAPRWNQKGAYFMDIDLGIKANKEDFKYFYTETSKRYFINTCLHDRTHGCDISIIDNEMRKVKDGSLLYGNMQAEGYFLHRKEEVKDWLKIKKEHDSYEFCLDNLCIINIRGGEYVGLKELFLDRKYFLNAINNMKEFKSNIEFLIITDDVATANKLLPNIEAKHFDIAKDYVSIKNAKYLILSNSSFAFFPAFTSDTVKYIIAPKYWARHNVSDGYWSTAQNIYSGWNYQDKYGKIFSSDECISEFEKYKRASNLYSLNTKPISFLNSKISNIKSFLIGK